MDIGSVLLGLALLAVIGFIVARPLLVQAPIDDRPASPAEQLTERREQLLSQLRDLDFDAAMSKINPEDYAAQRAQLVADGVAILKQLDALGSSSQAGAAADSASALAPGAMNAATPADEIEAAVAQLRARRAKPVRPAPVVRSLDDQIEASVAERRAARPAEADNNIVPAGKPAVAAKLACPQCAAEVLPEDRFCPKCGAPLTIACANCGRVGRVGDPFCANCGQAMAAPAAGLRQAEAQG